MYVAYALYIESAMSSASKSEVLEAYNILLIAFIIYLFKKFNFET